MKWKSLQFRPGQTRERLKFAWIPTACEDGYVRWLCTVRVVELFDPHPPFRLWHTLKNYPAEFEKRK
jgi:hypothetical protein